MKRIILCADDYGQNFAVSQAIIQLIKQERLSATSCMVTAPCWYEHATWLIPFKDQVDVGLHFNLTEGTPLSDLLQKSHGFLPLSRLIIRAFLSQISSVALEAELNAQLDLFEAAFGQLPDFIDGHQHVHHLPIIRDAILRVYKQRFRRKNTYIRSVYVQNKLLNVKHPAYIKSLIVQWVGAKPFKNSLNEQGIPHNTSFSGIYQFDKAVSYRRFFCQFLHHVGNLGIIMCHPGLNLRDEDDVINRARFQEFQYLRSDQFLQDCENVKVKLSRFF